MKTMRTTQRDKIISHLLSLPPVAWPQELKKLSENKRFAGEVGHFSDLARSMDDAAERLAFLSEYITTRFGISGCGEKTPEQAAKFAQKRQVKVTRALGYDPEYRRPFFCSTTPNEK